MSNAGNLVFFCQVRFADVNVVDVAMLLMRFRNLGDGSDAFCCVDKDED